MKKAPATEAAKRPTLKEYNSARLPTARGNRTLESTTRSYVESVDAILTALLQAGIEPVNPDSVLSRLADAEGRPVRFATANKPRHKNGWLIAYFQLGLPFVVIAGDWSTGAKIKWVNSNSADFSPSYRRQLQKAAKEDRIARQAEKARQWERQAATAARLWHSCKPANPQHPYLLHKGIAPHQARQRGRNLVLLLSDFSGKAWSLQTIDEAGNKWLMAGGKKAGNFIVVNGPNYPARALICEGYATGCTLAEMEPDSLVLAAVDCNNLTAVAVGARSRWPDLDLIVCGDDDRHKPFNMGRNAAYDAALAADANFALPEWPPEAPLHLSDFNDLAQWLRRAQCSK